MGIGLVVAADFIFRKCLQMAISVIAIAEVYTSIELDFCRFPVAQCFHAFTQAIGGCDMQNIKLAKLLKQLGCFLVLTESL